MATAEGAHDWRWDFGDGTDNRLGDTLWVRESVATHTYPAPGTYAVVAYARNCRDGAVATEPLEISVGDPNTIRLLRFEAQGCSEAFCVFARDEEITFTVETTAPADHYLYDWDGDGAVDQVTAQPVSHAYQEFGVYSPVLSVERGTAVDTLVHDRLILID